jgi:hypothetical protein
MIGIRRKGKNDGRECNWKASTYKTDSIASTYFLLKLCKTQNKTGGVITRAVVFSLIAEYS